MGTTSRLLVFLGAATLVAVACSSPGEPPPDGGTAMGGGAGGGGGFGGVGGGGGGTGGGAPCNTTTCPTGCCDSAGVCRAGTADNVCGKNGGLCQICNISAAQSCQNGTCVGGCDATSCPTGCCAGNACIEPTSNGQCGVAGSTCQACTGTSQCNRDAGICVQGTGGGAGGGSGGPPCVSSGDVSMLKGCAHAAPGCNALGTWSVSVQGGNLCMVPSTVSLTVSPCGGGVPPDAGCTFAASGSQVGSVLIAGQCFSTFTQIKLTLTGTDAGLTGSGTVSQSGEASCNATVTAVGN